MSGKQAKAKRKNGEKPLFQTVITVLKNGNIQVQGFPNNIRSSIKLIGDFTEAMWMYFIEQAKAGKIDKHGMIIKSPIYLPGEDNKKQAIKEVLDSPCKVHPEASDKPITGISVGD